MDCLSANRLYYMKSVYRMVNVVVVVISKVPTDCSIKVYCSRSNDNMCLCCVDNKIIICNGKANLPRDFNIIFHLSIGYKKESNNKKSFAEQSKYPVYAHICLHGCVHVVHIYQMWRPVSREFSQF